MTNRRLDAQRDLAPTGRLRVAINFGNPVLAQRDIATGEEQGVSVDIARALGRRFDMPVEIISFDATGEVFEACESGIWDVAFLAIDPVRSAKIVFTAPYVTIEGTYLVRSESQYRTVEDVDQEGVRIAVGKGAAYDLYLSRSLRHAALVRAATSAGAVDQFLADGLDAAAGVRQPLAAFARSHPEAHVIEGRFTVIEQALATPKGRHAAATALQAFMDEMKASGFIANAIKRSNHQSTAGSPASAGSSPS